MVSSGKMNVCFDFFGTLFDLSALAAEMEIVLESQDSGRFLETWRRKQLEYANILTVMGKHESFTAVTEKAMLYAATRHGIQIDGEKRRDLMDLWFKPKLYSDAEDAFESLSGFSLSILSNGDQYMLEKGAKHARIEGKFSHILSVEQSGVFKPHMNAYSTVTKATGASPSETLFVSSNGWDIAGASEFGFRTVWVNRDGLPAERIGDGPDFTVKDLTGIASLI